MKRIALLTMLSLATLSNLYAGAQRVVSSEVMTSGGSMVGWDDVQNLNNVTYNSTAKCYVTKATHTGDGYSKVIVYGTNITKTPIVGAGTDGVLISSANHYNTQKVLDGKVFTFKHPKDMSGQFVSFYSEGNTVLSSTDRFLRYP